MIIAVILGLLMGCVPGPTGTIRPLYSSEVEARQEAIAAWKSAGLEEVGLECLNDQASMRVSIVDSHADMFSAAGGHCGPSDENSFRKPDDLTLEDGSPTPWPQWQRLPNGDEIWCRWGRASGAYRRAVTGGVWPVAIFEDDWPLFVMWHSRASESLVYHESIHWLQECTGRGYNPWAPHDDSEVWCSEGCPGR